MYGLEFTGVGHRTPSPRTLARGSLDSLSTGRHTKFISMTLLPPYMIPASIRLTTMTLNPTHGRKHVKGPVPRAFYAIRPIRVEGLGFPRPDR